MSIDFVLLQNVSGDPSVAQTPQGAAVDTATGTYIGASAGNQDGTYSIHVRTINAQGNGWDLLTETTINPSADFSFDPPNIYQLQAIVGPWFFFGQYTTNETPATNLPVLQYELVGADLVPFAMVQLDPAQIPYISFSPNGTISILPYSVMGGLLSFHWLSFDIGSGALSLVADFADADATENIMPVVNDAGDVAYGVNAATTVGFQLAVCRQGGPQFLTFNLDASNPYSDPSTAFPWGNDLAVNSTRTSIRYTTDNRLMVGGVWTQTTAIPGTTASVQTFLQKFDAAYNPVTLQTYFDGQTDNGFDITAPAPFCVGGPGVDVETYFNYLIV